MEILNLANLAKIETELPDDAKAVRDGCLELISCLQKSYGDETGHIPQTLPYDSINRQVRIAFETIAEMETFRPIKYAYYGQMAKSSA
jgi:hypothetical protein